MNDHKTCIASFEIDPACPDVWEPDDSAALASDILSGVPQNHSICPIGDEDWATFTLDRESQVELRTSGLGGDTRMWLRDSGLTQLEYDDDPPAPRRESTAAPPARRSSPTSRRSA